ncbi:hypothetical protein ABZZ47_35020 [Streptomyces sp. NPDC006465]|uniref:hypothetical protein n=1 Tax=Streptomyces sp. NPDC006465 TaxID=3157174 RepID=UPI0033ABB026
MTTVPGVALAALATLSLGAVLGPEAPLIALGEGVAAGAIRMRNATLLPLPSPLSRRRAVSQRSAN